MSIPQFELRPSVGLSDIKLGTSLYVILNQLSHLHLQVSYTGGTKIATRPIVVLIKKFSIRLTFEPYKQLLVTIEVLDFKKLELVYKGTVIRDKSARTLYDHYIGPTYPGEIVDRCYVLSYPGMSFRFEYDGDEGLEELLKTNPKSDALVIHQFNKWSEVEDECDVKRVSQYEIELETIEYKEKERVITVVFFKHPTLKETVLKLGESKQQDILAILGPPDEVFTKNDSRTLIHSGDAAVKGGDSIFHNYFRLGFDLLYTTQKTGAVLSKVVIHSNLPTSVMFGRSSKCDWKYTNGRWLIMTMHDFPKIQECLPHVFTEKITPVVLNRNESISNTIELLEQDDEGEEIENEVKWGKSLVYATDGVIWEVVDDYVNSLTLY